MKVEKKDPNLLSVEDVREHCKLIRRSVETKEVYVSNIVLFSLFKLKAHYAGLFSQPKFLDLFRPGSCSACCVPCQ